MSLIHRGSSRPIYIFTIPPFTSLLLLAGCIVLALTLPAPSQEWTEESAYIRVLGDPEGSNDAELGTSVAASGDLVIAGAPGRDQRVIVWRRDALEDEYSLVQALEIERGDRFDKFGQSCDTDGAVIVVGSPKSPGWRGRGGAAYVFEENATSGEWTLKARLVPDETDSGFHFGTDVAVDQDWIVVGTPGADLLHAYRYDSSTDDWLLAQVLAGDEDSSHRFGLSLALCGDRLLVGDRGYFTDDARGAVHYYRLEEGEWEWVETLVAPGSLARRFGASIALDGTRAVIGDPAHGSDGSAFLFELDVDDDDWSFSEELSPSLGTDDFGISVAIRGERIVVGSEQGAFLFRSSEEDGWVESKHLGAESDRDRGFANEIAMTSDRVYVGQHNGLLQDRGGVKVYCSAAPDCNENCVSDDLEIRRLDASDCNDDGIPDECQVVPVLQTRIEPELEDVSMVFGRSTDVNGSRAIVGAPLDSSIETYAGSAWIYEFIDEEWTLAVELTRESPVAFDKFGRSVAIDGDLAVVGVPRVDESDDLLNTGAVEVFRRSRRGEWSRIQILIPEGLTASEEFGHSLSLASETLVVGAFKWDDEFTDEGTAYAFTWDESLEEFVLESRLSSTDPMRMALFGSSVATDGPTIVVGARGHDSKGTEQGGSVHVFRRTSSGEWACAQVIVPEGSKDLRHFGDEVAVDGDILLVGSNQDRLMGVLHDKYCTLYERRGNVFRKGEKLVVPEGSTGNAVAVHGDRIVTGGWSDADERGAAHLFRYNGADWIHQESWSGEKFDRLGRSVSIHGPVLAVGVPSIPMNSAHPGVVDLIVLRDCDGNLRPDSCDLEEDDSNENEIPDICEQGDVFVTEDERFLRGDVDGDGEVKVIVDAYVLLQQVYHDGNALSCRDAADVNDDGSVSGIADALHLILWGFYDGEEIPPPGPAACGRDEVPDRLDCAGASAGC